jgi:MFS family permease
MGRIRAYVNRFRGFERDARVFLAGSLLASVGISLYWIDFNLYLAALGHSTATIGLIATGSSLASALIAFPMSSLSNRIGRRAVMLLGGLLMVVALVGLLLTSDLALLAVFGATYAAGQQTFFVVSTPFMTEHSRPNQRSELFSLQFAIMQATSIGAGLLGGLVAAAAVKGTGSDGIAVYRVVLLVQLAFTLAGFAVMTRLSRDRPAVAGGQATTVRPRASWRRLAFGVTIADRGLWVRLLLPGFLISVGAGQIIPFLNLFVAGKFGIDLAGVSAIYALTSFGTMLAILLQPALANRYGKVASVVIVQSVSIPFLVVLGFSPILWTVVVAMAIRNSLMNAGNPIQNAFAMEQVRPVERATLAAAMSALWSLGWVIAGPWYSFLQATFGFTTGYSIGFVTIISLYSIATILYWRWFRGAERSHVPIAAPLTPTGAIEAPGATMGHAIGEG